MELAQYQDVGRNTRKYIGKKLTSIRKQIRSDFSLFFPFIIFFRVTIECDKVETGRKLLLNYLSKLGLEIN